MHYRSIHASDNKNGDEQYLDMLSQLEETINKYYGNGHQVIVCGNMNASTNRDNRSRDKHVQHFLERNSLRQTDDYPNIPTFYHHNGLYMYTSQIDIILHKGRESNISYKVQNEGLHPLNASDHCLLTAKFHVKLKNTKNTNRTPQIVKKPNWNKCDKGKYQESVQQSLEKLDTSKAKDSTGKISELAGNAGIPDYGKVITIKPVDKEYGIER